MDDDEDTDAETNNNNAQQTQPAEANNAGTTTPTNPTPPAAPEARFSEADIERAREQEKNKLYGKLESEKERAARLEKENQELKSAKEAWEKQKQAEADAAEKARLEQMSTEEQVLEQQRKLMEEQKLMREQLELQRKELAEQEARHKSEMQVQRLEAYKLQKLSEVNLSFPELVQGSTVEEIDASIAAIKEREDALRQNMVTDAQRAVETQITEDLGAQLPQPRGSETPPEQPNCQGVAPDYTKLSRREIAKLSPAEYKKYTQQLRQNARSNPT